MKMSPLLPPRKRGGSARRAGVGFFLVQAFLNNIGARAPSWNAMDGDTPPSRGPVGRVA